MNSVQVYTGIYRYTQVQVYYTGIYRYIVQVIVVCKDTCDDKS